MSQERIAFENWLGIKPCGAAHDLAWAAWQASASLPAHQQATPEPAGEPVAQVSDLFPSVRNKLHAQGFDSDAPLFTRPATGVPEWQPIETAPKDGRDLILLLTPSGFPQVTYSNTWWQSGFSVECRPTGWMPLPAHPLAAAQAKGD